MSSKKSLAARLLTRALRGRPAAPIRKPVGPVGGRIELLEDRITPVAGDLDTAFGTGGVVTTSYSPLFTSGRGAALQPDGKVVVVGYANGPNIFESALTRYNADGSLDGTFGSGGKIVADLGGSDNLTAVAVQPDGKIVVAGSSNNGGNASYNFTVARYTSAGVLDTTFGTAATGVVVVAFGNSTSATALAIQPDGKIVAGGNQYDGATENFAVVRLTTTGVLDSTFGTGGSGIVTTDFSASNEQVAAVAVQPDGKIVAAGRTGTANNGAGDLEDFALARYTSAGVLDTTFGAAGTGKVVTDFAGKEDNVFGLALQPDGKIVAGGVATVVGSTTNFALARYTTGGVLDTTFGTAATGKVTTDFGGLGSFARAIAIQPNGKIVLAGSTFVGSQVDFGLARYTAAGTLDTTFGAAATGKVTTDIGANHNYGFAVVAQPDGQVVVVGQAGLSSPVVALARYLGDPPPPPNYTFTLVADSAGPFNGFNSISVNNSGLVAFLASLDAGGTGVYTGTGGPVTTVVDTTGAYPGITSLTAGNINDAGTVVFKQSFDTIYTRTGAGPITVVSDVSGPALSLANAPSINNNGQVSFFANLDGGGWAVSRAEPNGGSFTLTPIAGNGNGFVTASDGLVTPLNNNGVVVAEGFRSISSGTDYLDIFTGSGGPLTTIAQNTSGPLANVGLRTGHRSINDAGAVAFVARSPDVSTGTYTILTGSGGTHAAVADTTGPYKFLTNPTINNLGKVAFYGQLDDDRLGVWTGPDAIADKVLVAGDALFGSTVTGAYVLSPDAHNDAGQIALYVELADGRRAVVRADPAVAAGLTAALAGGTLTVTDTAGAANAVTATVSGTDLVLTDATQQFSAGVGTLSNGNRTLTVPLASVTSLVVNLAGGNDTLTIDLTGGDPIPAGGLTFHGGAAGDDGLVITGGTNQGTVTYNFTNANDGSVVMSNFGTVTYTGLEPIANSGTAADVVFNLPASGNVQAILEDDGATGNTLSRFRSSPVAFEQVDFANPTGSLTINRGSETDDLAVNALPDFDAALTVGTAADTFDTLTFNGAVALSGGSHLTAFATGTISLPSGASDITSTGGAAVSLTTTRDIRLAGGASITTENGGLTLSANAAGSRGATSSASPSAVPRSARPAVAGSA